MEQQLHTGAEAQPPAEPKTNCPHRSSVSSYAGQRQDSRMAFWVFLGFFGFFVLFFLT